jgi:PKD repeat protein
MRLKTIYFILLIITLTNYYSQTKTIPYQQLQGTSGMFFGANMSASTITITFSGPDNRWIAIGFGVSMSPADALIYTNGRNGFTHPLGWNDYYCANTSASNVNIDAVQDWTIHSNTVSAGQRTVVASRVLNTGDSNDAIFSFTSTSLNIVWARGATADYTLAYHGNTNRGSGISLPWLSQPVANFTTATTNVCVGSSLTFSNTSVGGQTTYTWNFSGTNVASSTQTNPVVTYTSVGVFSVALTSSNAVGSASLLQTNYITVNPTVVPSVSITQSGGLNPICSGAVATYTASHTNGGSAPNYQWKVNGINSGNNSPTFSTSALPNNAQVSLVMTSNQLCALPNTVSTTPITMTVNSSAAATVSAGITNGGNPSCMGSLITFTATPGNGGSSPSYQWKINNLLVGGTGSTFTTNSLSNADVVTCQIISSSSCAITTTAVSSAIIITVSAVLIPSLSIQQHIGNNPNCFGAAVGFSAATQNGGNTPTFQWNVNGLNAGTNNAIFTPSNLVNGDVVTCVLNSSFPCASPNTATSSAITLTVHPIPVTPIITPTGSVTLCSGKSVTLSSSLPFNNNWSNGGTSQAIVVSSAGNYFVTQTLNGCSSLPSANTSVFIIPSPVATLASVSNLCLTDAPYTLKGLPLGGTYSGAGVTGGVFNPIAAASGTHAVTYNFSDSNLCSDTAAISIIVSECLSISELDTKSSISIFPNPSHGLFSISATNQTIINIKVIDIHNRIVYNNTLDNKITPTINLETYTPGIYFFEIQLEQTIFRKRVVLLE